MYDSQLNVVVANGMKEKKNTNKMSRPKENNYGNMPKIENSNLIE